MVPRRRGRTRFPEGLGELADVGGVARRPREVLEVGVELGVREADGGHAGVGGVGHAVDDRLRARARVVHRVEVGPQTPHLPRGPFLSARAQCRGNGKVPPIHEQLCMTTHASWTHAERQGTGAGAKEGWGGTFPVLNILMTADLAPMRVTKMETRSSLGGWITTSPEKHSLSGRVLSRGSEREREKAGARAREGDGEMTRGRERAAAETAWFEAAASAAARCLNPRLLHSSAGEAVSEVANEFRSYECRRGAQ